jgi:hypothetical protein
LLLLLLLKMLLLLLLLESSHAGAVAHRSPELILCSDSVGSAVNCRLRGAGSCGERELAAKFSG